MNSGIVGLLKTIILIFSLVGSACACVPQENVIDKKNLEVLKKLNYSAAQKHEQLPIHFPHKLNLYLLEKLKELTQPKLLALKVS